MVDNKSQLSSHLENRNKANNWKTTNNHEGELVVAYNNNAGKIHYTQEHSMCCILLDQMIAVTAIWYLNYQQNTY